MQREDQFAADFDQELTSSRSGMYARHKVWLYCQAFVEGQQWMTWDTKYQVWRKMERDWRAQPTINLLLDIYRTLLSRMAVSYPGVEVGSSSRFADDIVKAKGSETALRWWWRAGRLSAMYRRLMEWLLITGNGGTHTYYDGQDIVCDVVSPFDTFFEHGARSPKESRWVAIRTWTTKEALLSTYEDKADVIEGFGITAKSTAQTGTTSTPVAERREPPDRIEVYEVYFKDRRHGIYSNGHWLSTGEWKTKHCPVQLYHFTHHPERIYGTGIIEHAIELQMLYNRARGHVMQAIANMANPKWRVHVSADLPDYAINNEPGEVLEWAGQFPPDQVAMAPLPGHVMWDVQRIQSEIGDVVGAHGSLMGKRQVDISAAKAMQQLVSNDLSGLGVTMLDMQDGAEQMAVTFLELAATYWTEEKHIAIHGHDGRWIHTAVSTVDLVEAPEVFITSSMFRDDSATRTQALLSWHEAGLIPKEIVQEELTYSIGFGFMREKAAALAHSEDLLQACVAGHAVEVWDTDDLDSVLKVFRDFMRTPDYYALDGETQDYIRDVFVDVEARKLQLGNDEYLQKKAQQKVFPRTVAPGLPEDRQIAPTMVQGSPAAQAQTAAAQMEMAEMKQGFDGLRAEARQASDANANTMARRYGGGL